MEEKIGRACKELMLKEIEEALRANSNLIITNYLGLSVMDLEGLRKNLKKNSAQYLVVKNSICKRVFESLKLSDLVKDIDGGVGLGLLSAESDLTLTSKAIVDFARKNNALKIKSGFIDGEYVDVDKIRLLASLPRREGLLAMVLQAMNGPITGFVSVLEGLIRKFAYVVNAIKEQKEKGGK